MENRDTKYHCLIIIILMRLLYYSIVFLKLDKKLSANISRIFSINDSLKKNKSEN
jgi:hypothetical protein